MGSWQYCECGRGITPNDEEVIDGGAMLAQRFPLDGERGATLGTIGRAVGLSKERVRQIQNGALHKLRAILNADPLLQ